MTFAHYVRVSARGSTGTIEIDRPESRNALDGQGWRSLIAGIEQLTRVPSVRVVVIQSVGSVFSAGGDFDWMRGADEAGLRVIVETLDAITTCPKPIVARVHAPAFGGAVGLIAACDWAIASEGVRFSLSEVRIGLAPAIVSRAVIARVGPTRFRGWALTAMPVDAGAALAAGLIDEVVSAADSGLDKAIDDVVRILCQGEPGALAEVKRMFPTGLPGDQAVSTLVRLRSHETFAEGVAALREKRHPSWVPED
jgi:methylglutaconyl-CoA hydratase